MNALLPLFIVGVWAAVAIVMLAVGYRRPAFHWALVVYFFVSIVVGAIWAFVRWGWPA